MYACPRGYEEAKDVGKGRKMSVHAIGWPIIFLLLVPLVSDPSFGYSGNSLLIALVGEH